MAAGASRRLGQPKQLLDFKSQTLIRKISKEALEAEVGEVTVVTGFDHTRIEKEIQDLPLEVFYNSFWEEGLGASIRNGLKHILKAKPDTDAILLALVDQPYVDSIHLKKLANSFDRSQPMIIASAYSGTFGVPVLFDRMYFKEMMNLKGDEGGKKVFLKYLKKIVEIPFAAGSIDIDQQNDLINLQ